jgi:hypothetical protein
MTPYKSWSSAAYDRMQARLWQATAALEYRNAAECRDHPERNGMTPLELQKMYQKRAAYASMRARRHMGLEP